VQRLFKKPCFGALEADKSPLNLSHCQRKTANEIQILEVKPQLARKSKNSLWTCFKEKTFLKWDATVKKNSMITKFLNPNTLNNSTKQYMNDEKVYMVPLPNFTAYPPNVNNHPQGLITTLWKFIKIMIYPRSRVITKDKYSPFLHVIDNENDTRMYNCPSIIAATEFKWASARKHFLRHFVMYLIFVISFAISAGDFTSRKLARSITFESHKSVALWANVISLYIGYHLFVSELIQLKRELKDPVASQFSVDSYLIKNASNLTQNLFPNITIQHNVDPTTRSDNYFSTFASSVEAVYFWTNGRWDQLSNWDSTAVDIMKADMTGKYAARKYRAEMICDYETLEKPLDSKRGNPRYIYYIANSDFIDKWLNENKAYQQKSWSAHTDSDDDKIFDDSDSDGDDENDGTINDKSSDIKKRDIPDGSSDFCGSYKMNGSYYLHDEENYKSISTATLKDSLSKKSHLKENNDENSRSINFNDTIVTSHSGPQLPILIDDNLDMSEQVEKISKRLKILEEGTGDKDKNKNREFENRFKALERNINTILVKLNKLSN
ncbi:8470_t:CDS:2, partial [Dentiscutata erythropus]